MKKLLILQICAVFISSIALRRGCIYPRFGKAYESSGTTVLTNGLKSLAKHMINGIAERQILPINTLLELENITLERQICVFESNKISISVHLKSISVTGFCNIVAHEPSINAKELQAHYILAVPTLTANIRDFRLSAEAVFKIQSDMSTIRATLSDIAASVEIKVEEISKAGFKYYNLIDSIFFIEVHSADFILIGDNYTSVVLSDHLGEIKWQKTTILSRFSLQMTNILKNTIHDKIMEILINVPAYKLPEY